MKATLMIDGEPVSHRQMLRIARLADATGVRDSSGLASVLTLSGCILADMPTVAAIEPLAKATMLLLGELLSPEGYCLEVDTWNQKHPIGTWIRFWDTVADEHYISRTISVAICSDHAEPVVLIENCTAPVLLAVVKPLSKSVADLMSIESSKY